MTNVASFVGADGATVQRLLTRLAADCRGRGMNVVGMIGEPHGVPGRTCGAGLLRDIVSSRTYSIYLETAPAHTSCHIDAAGVEAACAAIVNEVSAADLVILSKFGKLETMRRGLFAAFEAACAAGKPLLTSVSEKHRDAWQAFAPHAAFLSPDEAAVRNWLQIALQNVARRQK